MAKHKRVISDEVRQAARERMKAMWAKKRGAPVVEDLSDIAPVATMEKKRDPEVQAVLDSMSPERKAKLAMIQNRMLQSKEGQEALARHEAEKQAVTQTIVIDPAPVLTEPVKIGTPGALIPPARIGSREVNLIVRTDGTVVSQYGPCLCGAPKREWHRICVKER